MRANILIFIALGTMISTLGWAQQDKKVWTLDECIVHAQKNNIVVQQSQLKTEDKAIALNTKKNSRLPSLDASVGANMYFGRGPSRDGTYTDNNQLSASFSLSTSVDIYNGSRIRNQIEVGKLDLSASASDFESAREDVAINVVSLYLQVLYDKELVKVAQTQLALSVEQAERSLALYESGKQSQSAVFESDALVARDESLLVQRKNALSLSLLDLSQALNRDSADDFDIAEESIDALAVTSLSLLPSPQNTYDYALDNRPMIKAEKLRLLSSEYNLRVAKSYLYPRIALSGGYGNNIYRSFSGGGVNYDFFDQLSNNGNEYIGLSVNVPIFNRMATRNQIKSAKLGIQSQQLMLTETERNLRKVIEKAYHNALAGYSQYCASDKALASARVAFEFEKEKASVGRSTVFDFNDAKTRMEKAEAELVQAKYDFVFRRKILDFYGGKPLTM